MVTMTLFRKKKTVCPKRLGQNTMGYIFIYSTACYDKYYDCIINTLGECVQGLLYYIYHSNTTSTILFCVL